MRRRARTSVRRWRAERTAPAGLGPRLRQACGLALLLVGSACAEPPVSPTVRVLAAASLTEVIQALGAGFEPERVEVSFGSSSSLARQIRDGVPADVFVSASPEWIAFLREAGALVGAPIVVAHNRIVCVRARGSPLEARDPRALVGQLGVDGRVGIADAGVPAGEYARRSLERLGLHGAYARILVGHKDVRAALHAVERGELEVGFVYATDARVAAVDVLFELDPDARRPIEYQAARLRGAPNPDGALRFVRYLRSDAAHELLLDAGFSLP